jgi:PEP-CTERM/exosortase A-associated glycosyltransferase
MRVLHVLDHYKPHFDGYVFRTSYILKYQKEFGLEPVIITSPKHGKVDTSLEEIDNLKVYRTLPQDFGNIPFLGEVKLMKAFQDRIEEVIQIEKPNIIHAHSPSLNGIPALRAGRKCGIRVVYEIRAFWEDAAVDQGKFREGSFKYRVSRFVETFLIKRVDALFTICEGLRKELITRGIFDDKIVVIPNCVDTVYFSPVPYDEEIASRYGLKDKIVCGFIGSFYDYEGVDLLLEGYKRVLEIRKDVKLFLVGDGLEKDNLQEKASKMGLTDSAVFTGKVPHEQIKRYYSVMDILVYPRKKLRLTELVTPLKPLEAMSLGKVVVGSDVGGIKELITPDQDGFLFQAEDLDDLVRVLRYLIDHKKDLNAISKAAVETIQKRHRWELAVKKYLPVYERLIL